MTARRPTLLSTPVLIVDDSSPVRTMVKRMLFDIGLRSTVEAGDVHEAFAALQKVRPGLILIDWFLPEGTCEQMVRTVRDPRRSSCPDVPIVALTARPTISVVDRAHELGINSLLRKPFSPRMLWDHVSAALPRADAGAFGRF
jgi:two-component system chemotaxis response regulator CheY